jgi:hypothetical protein
MGTERQWPLEVPAGTGMGRDAGTDEPFLLSEFGIAHVVAVAVEVFGFNADGPSDTALP